MMNLTPTLQDCELLDAQDPLRSLRDQFDLPQGVIYLDGNSLAGAHGLMDAAGQNLTVDNLITREFSGSGFVVWNDGALDC
jgi:kynureninase